MVEFAKFQYPMEIKEHHVVGIAIVAVLVVIAVLLNLLLFIGRILTVRKADTLTGFDCIVLNLIFTNLFLAALVYPYDVVVYVMFDQVWIFSTSFCYASTVFTSVFPFIACWSVVAMTLHQFFAYAASINRMKFPASRRKVHTSITLCGPMTLLWLFTLCVYCPVAHILWTVDVGPYTCRLEGENGLLHDSMWYFWIPFSCIGFALAATGILFSKTKVPFPIDGSSFSTSEEPAVRWSDITTQQEVNQPSPLRPNPDVYSSLNPLYMDYPSDAAGVAAESYYGKEKTTPTSLHASLKMEPPNNQELRREHVWIIFLLTCTLIVFVAPYAVVVLLFHIRDPYPAIEKELAIGVIAWEVTFTWMTCKTILEAPLLLIVSPKYRRAFCAAICCR
ncbi:hypothetical protein BV898_00058 [Hypsibius exemplaris]|uniref:G-protein coupled receptors family 1 profile domain-containing protein n=1 Tax=Hypsibius exemplaris TaxID=2072580 RepID=A0A1W0XEL2_HYPEX|nr:hypothetical protein BV898_00058 [Hypsibius exemplaris]